MKAFYKEQEIIKEYSNEYRQLNLIYSFHGKYQLCKVDGKMIQTDLVDETEPIIYTSLEEAKKSPFYRDDFPSVVITKGKTTDAANWGVELLEKATA